MRTPKRISMNDEKTEIITAIKGPDGKVELVFHTEDCSFSTSVYLNNKAVRELKEIFE